MSSSCLVHLVEMKYIFCGIKVNLRAENMY
jgi:hypothetical protein